MDQALAECAKAEARARPREPKRAMMDGGSANIDSLKAAAERADAAALKADEAMAQEVDRIGDAPAAKLTKRRRRRRAPQGTKETLRCDGGVALAPLD